MSTLIPIVGAFYRPPAQVLLNNLPIGTPLFLLAEPTNPYDLNAIAVFLESHWFNLISANISEKLDKELQPYGFNVNIVLNQMHWHLGYVPKQTAAMLRASGAVPDDTPINGTFAVNAAGAPRFKPIN